MHTKTTYTKTTKETGNLGEDLACEFLQKKGYFIVGRNYLKKWGEIDIVAHETSGKVHFVEVKSVTCETKDGVSGKMVPRVTNGEYRPEDNVHPKKLQRMRRVIQSYLIENESAVGNGWQFDIVTVKLSLKDMKAYCKLLKDIVL